MSTTVNAYNSAASAGVLQSAGTLSSSTAPRAKADAEIIAQVMTAEIKPSNINEVRQPRNLLQQGQHNVWHLVRLRQHRRCSLLHDLTLGEFRCFSSKVCIHNR